MSFDTEKNGDVRTETTSGNLENRPLAIKENPNDERKSTEYKQNENNKTGLVCFKSNV